MDGSYLNFETQHICEKQIRFLKQPGNNLSSYYSTKSQAIKLAECDIIPEVLLSKLTSSQTAKCLPRLPSNNIMIVSLVILETAYEDKRNQELLNKIKRYAYNQNLLIIQLLEVSQRGKHNELVIKKLFVEFFHLVASSSDKNKVEKFMYKYPIMQCVFILLFRKILALNGISDAGNLQLPIPTLWIIETLCKVFQISYKVHSSGHFQITGRVVMEDASYIYKICDKQFQLSGSSVSKEQEMISRLLDDSVCEPSLKLTSNTQISTESRLQFPRPQSVRTNLPPKSSTKIQNMALFPRKQVDSFSNVKKVNVKMPLSFAKVKPRSQTPTPQQSYINSQYRPSQSSHTCIPHEKELGHQRSSSGNNLFNLENKSNYNTHTPGIERQKSYQGLPEIKISSFSPQRRSKIFEYKIQQIPRTTTPLSYFNQPLLSKNSEFLDRRWNMNKVDNIEAYRFDSKNYQFGF